MRKAFKLVAALGMVATMAAPAMAASVDYSGFLRVKGYESNYFDSRTANFTPSKLNGAQTYTYVDQRWRGKFTVGDENVKAVTFLELNEKWGDTTTGGRIGTDGTDQLRAKNVYLWFKIPDTTVDFTVGLQNVTDAYAGVFFGAMDVAGAFTTFKPVEALAFRLGAAVPYQTTLASGSEQANSQNTKLFIAEAKFAPAKDVKVGANLYFMRDGFTAWAPGGNAIGTFANPGTTKLYVPGVDFAVNAGVATVSGFVFGQFGDRTYFSGAEKTKFGGYAADLRADVNAGPAKVFAEALYTSGDKPSANKYEGLVVMDDYRFGSGSSTFNRTNMEIITSPPDAIGSGRTITYDQNNQGRGEILLAAGASAEVAPKLTVKGNVGYLRANKFLAAEENTGRGKNQAIELNATVSYNVTKGLDAGLTGAYVFAGDLYKPTGAQSPTDPYAVVARLNYAY